MLSRLVVRFRDHFSACPVVVVLGCFGGIVNLVGLCGAGRGENRTRIRRQRAFAQLTALLGYAYGRSARHAPRRDNTPLTSKNRLWRRIPVQNPLYPVSTLVCTTPANRRSAVQTTSDIDTGVAGKQEKDQLGRKVSLASAVAAVLALMYPLPARRLVCWGHIEAVIRIRAVGTA